MDLSREYAAVQLGDARLDRRLVRLANRLSANPSVSLPAAVGTDAELEATYRLLNNPRVSPESILAPHIAATAERAAATGTLVVAHDTSEFGFSTQRRGLGRIGDGELGRGFFLHAALAISFDGRREPLGVLGAQRFVRMQAPQRKKGRHTERKPEHERESRRWGDLVESVSAQLVDPGSAIHVMDREADDYLLFSRLVADSRRFVIRARSDRAVQLDDQRGRTLRHVLGPLTARLERSIALSPRERKPMAHRHNPSIEARSAQLELCATAVAICRPGTVTTERSIPDTLTLHMVHVREVNTPPDYEPVDWKLWTTEPIETPEQIEAIVDAYLLRWLIEEYFKALKTGCDFERRQLESDDSIYNALAVFMPIAWGLLRLRFLSRTAPQRPAGDVLSPLQLLVLRRHPDVKLPPQPTARDAMLAVARLGGHIKSNGEPGWIVLGRGYERLLELEAGARLVVDGEM